MTVVLLEEIDPRARAILEAVDKVVLAPEPNGSLPVAQEDVSALVTRGIGRVDRGLLCSCRGLQAVARCGVGLDNIDLVAAKELGIPVAYAPGGTTRAVAEHTLLLILALSRGLYPAVAGVKQGDWSIRNRLECDDIGGKTLGVVGLGAIGRRVAELASACGLEIRYWSRCSTDARFEELELAELFRTSHLVSLHVALNDQTRGMVSRELIDSMPSMALLINTARGELVDEGAVAEALEDGRLGGYAADVLVEEPPARDSKLVAHPRTLITPHSASLTAATFREICEAPARAVAAILSGTSPDPENLWSG